MMFFKGEKETRTSDFFPIIANLNGIFGIRPIRIAGTVFEQLFIGYSL